MTEDRTEGRSTHEGYLDELKTKFIEKGYNSTEFAVFSLALDYEATFAYATEALRSSREAGESSYASEMAVRRYWLAHNAVDEKARLVMSAVPCLKNSFSEAKELIGATFAASRKENPKATFPEVETIKQLQTLRDNVVKQGS